MINILGFCKAFLRWQLMCLTIWESLQSTYSVGMDVTSSHLTLTRVISLVSFTVRMSGLNEVALLDH